MTFLEQLEKEREKGAKKGVQKNVLIRSASVSVRMSFTRRILNCGNSLNL